MRPGKAAVGAHCSGSGVPNTPVNSLTRTTGWVQEQGSSSGWCLEPERD